ncbi:hypothetical protein KY289_006338 [Solanum tuberosum]|nr:hypothetical protein KY289_006338 [Solanum tuberosum]
MGADTCFCLLPGQRREEENKKKNRVPPDLLIAFPSITVSSVKALNRAGVVLYCLDCRIDVNVEHLSLFTDGRNWAGLGELNMGWELRKLRVGLLGLEKERLGCCWELEKPI